MIVYVRCALCVMRFVFLHCIEDFTWLHARMKAVILISADGHTRHLAVVIFWL